MVDRIAEIYFKWREVARCPQVSNSLPHVRTKLGTVIEVLTLSLVRVHTFCRAELEEERNTTKALKYKKISGELFLAEEEDNRAALSLPPPPITVATVALTPLCIIIFSKTLRRSCPGIPGDAIRGWASSSWSVKNADISILIGLGRRQSMRGTRS